MAGYFPVPVAILSNNVVAKNIRGIFVSNKTGNIYETVGFLRL